MVSPLSVEVFGIWLERGTADRTIERKRKEAVQRQKIARRALANWDVQAHPSSLHVWLRPPRWWQTAELVEHARRWNIAVTPAQAFWMRASPAPPAVRISLGGVDERKALKRGLTTIGRILAKSS